MLPEKIQTLRDTLSELPGRLATGARVMAQSGLLFEFGLSGLRAAALAAISGSRNPSLIFSLHAAITPEKPAILWRDRRLSFGELDRRMNRAAGGLKGRG